MFSLFSTPTIAQKSDVGGGKAVTHEPVLSLPAHIPTPELPPLLTPEQEEKLTEVRAAVIPALLIDPAEDKVLRREEEEWANDRTLLQFLRATRWDAEQAVTRLETTLKWRRSYLPHRITPDEVEEESRTGKIVINGFDLLGRPIIYLVPARENTRTYDRQIRHVVFTLERCIRIMPPNVEQVVILVDFERISFTTAPPLNVTRRFLQTLGDHYPERFGLGALVNPSWFISGFFQLISPFMDPVTKSKIKITDIRHNHRHKSEECAAAPRVDGLGAWVNLFDHIDARDLDSMFGGDLNFEHKHEVYWKAISAVGNN
ncbi:CRAL-TRIO domain-containing protein [Cladochytrium replicatum]|nr:CRAL-TRIO domain-containing protein [Cladochytrium replicatum]